MSPRISPLASVDPQAQLADDVFIGPFCHVGPHVTIGPGTRLDSHVTIVGHTTIGKNNRFFPNCVIGTPPQDVSWREEAETYLEIGDDNIFREGVTVNRGADSVPGRHARVSLRYLAGDVAHTLVLDSGTVRVRRDGAVLAGSIGGSGFDDAENVRPLVDAVFQGIRPLPDSEPCGAAGA